MFYIAENKHIEYKIDCNKPFNVFYLKPSEKTTASEILNNQDNAIVVIPEENYLIAKTEILMCDSFDYSDYINLGDN